jgi:signal transduction histidine kinase
MTIEEHDGTVEWGPLPDVGADPSQLRQLFRNLVTNALEHSGPGIESHRQDDIFQMVESSERDQTTGQVSGVGLAMCENIVDRHDGEFHAESEPGDGATFVFTIPR